MNRGKFKSKPNKVLHPGDTLQEALDECEINPETLASRTNLTVKTIEDVIKGEAEITSEMAIELDTALGIEARFWTDIQADWLYVKKELRAILSKKDTK